MKAANFHCLLLNKQNAMRCGDDNKNKIMTNLHFELIPIELPIVYFCWLFCVCVCLACVVFAVSKQQDMCMFRYARAKLSTIFRIAID